ncbi:MAG: O-antigen ligase family protein [Thermodesulfobacteriota bacterium]
MQRVSYYLFIFLLIFCPLAFGTVEPWSLTVMEFMAPLALLLYMVGSRKGPGSWQRVPGLVPLLLFLLFMALQLLPLPQALLALLSPAGSELYQPARVVAGTSSSSSLWLPISVNPLATAQELCRYLAYGCFYVLTVQLCSRYKRLRRTMLIVVALAAGIAFLAVIQKFLSPDKIYWFRPVPGNATASGPWIYRNHFSGFMEMTLPLALALFLHYRPRIRYDISWREKIYSLFTLPHANLHTLLGFAAILSGLAIVVSLSRGGTISMLIALLLFVVLLRWTGQVRRGVVPLTGCILLVLLATTWFGWEPVVERFNRMTNSENVLFDGRFLIWADTMPIIRDYLMTGAGFGSFIHIYPLYRQEMGGERLVDHAHNDYLELLTDGGLVAALLVFCFLVSIFWQSGRRLAKRRDSFAKLLFSAAATSIGAILVHSVTDFNMHNGANGLYFFFVCGLLVAASHTRRRGGARPSYLPAQQMPLFAAGLPLLLLLAITSVNLGMIQATGLLRPLARVYLNPNIPAERLAEMAAQARLASAKARFDARPPFQLANIATFQGDYELAKQNYGLALRYNPTNPAYLAQAGLYLGQREEEAGRVLLTAAAKGERTNPEISKDLADWLLRQGDTEKGLAQLRQAMTMEEGRGNFSEYVALALIHDLDLSAMEKVLPQEAQAHIRFAAFLVKQGEEEMAATYYLRAMDLVAEQSSKARFFTAPYYFFMGRDDYDKALLVIRKGVAFHPDDANLQILAGEVYRKMGISYRAAEHFRQALLISPGNSRATRGLAALEE